MGSFIDTVSSLLSQSERQVEIMAQNVSNVTTPGYKRHLSFSALVAQNRPHMGQNAEQPVAVDLTPGKLMDTGKPYDLAVAGKGFFVAASSSGGLVYTRQGQFQVDEDGRLVTAQGFPLQADGGGDIRLKSSNIKIQEDGSVLDNNEPVAKLAVVDFTNPEAVTDAAGGGFIAPDNAVTRVEKPSVHQGMLEASNVSMGAEMVSMMAALRRAETGQKLIGVYDDLMGRVLSLVGQS